LQLYSSRKLKQFDGCDETVAFCLRMNDLFDALNRKQPNEGLRLNSKDLQVTVKKKN